MNVKSLRAPGRDLHIHDLVGSRKNHPQPFPGYRLDSIQLAKCCDLDSLRGQIWVRMESATDPMPTRSGHGIQRDDCVL